MTDTTHDDETAANSTPTQRRNLIRSGATLGAVAATTVLGLGGAQAQTPGTAPAAAARPASEAFAGKVAFVTGAASGIGRATALAFAREGAKVALVDIQEQANQETERLIKQAGGQALAITADVSKGEAVQSALARTVEAFGGLDFAFNNAGVEQPPAPIAELSEAEFDRLVANDLRSVFLCMKYQVPLIQKRGGGSIVNTSSGAGIKGFAGGAAYGAAKHGIIGLTRCAALDYAKAGIRVNAVCPGIIDTPMMDRFSGGTAEGRAKVIAQEPVGRMGRPEEIASTVLWLCQDGSAFTTGAVFVIDGGQTV